MTSRTSANVVDATIRAADAPRRERTDFNVAAGSPASVNHVAETIGVILGKPVQKRLRATASGDIRDSWADISSARELLGYEPSIDLEEARGSRPRPCSAEPGELSYTGAAERCSSRRYWWMNAIAMLPSPTAAATRFTRPERTSPHAKTPGTLVSSR